MNSLVIDRPLSLHRLPFRSSLAVLALGPHPDDFDAIGVTLRTFWERGNPLKVAVATGGASGVEDSFCSPHTRENKTQLRLQEQKLSCRFFGLSESQLEFLFLAEDEAGHPVLNEENTELVRACFRRMQPAMVFLPHPNDTNLGHQRIAAMLKQAAQEAESPLVIFWNQDPKTVQMRCDVVTGYGANLATWKAELLRHHQSQHQRNLNQCGRGFDERILGMDRQSAELCNHAAPYAEVFELEFYRGSRLEDFLETSKGGKA